jgi:nitrogenase molybdenum-iron protein beta chain
MLLRHTDAEVKERKALTLNPAKTCQPIGAMYAALGVNGCLPHSHGSQGCAAYHRSTLTRHYKEPVMAATSSFTEGSAVFGGQSNLLAAIQNIFSIYNPEVIAVHTTCLSETIGDDLVQIVKKAQDDGKIPDGKTVVYANTPSYVGSHVTGFSSMVAGLVNCLAEKGESTGQLNVIPGWVEPADMREIKRILEAFGIEALVFPDTSGVLDSPQTGISEMYPAGGVTVEQLRRCGSATHTIGLGESASAAGAKALEKKCGVQQTVLELPIGLRATDRFIQALSDVTGIAVPASLREERGRLVDMITDTNQYCYGKRAALWGDPDQLVSLSEFLADLNMQPVYVVTGTPGKAFIKRLEAVVGTRVANQRIKCGATADMYLMHQWIKGESVDLLIGNTYGKYIARDEDIPLVRHGFPILDRVGHQYFPTVGYRGATRLLEQMLTAFLDRQDRDAKEEAFELVM